MSSDTQILYSEGNPLLVHWDNGIMINYKLDDDDIKSLKEAIETNNKSGYGKLTARKEIWGLMITLPGSNTNLEFGISKGRLDDFYRSLPLTKNGKS